MYFVTIDCGTTNSRAYVVDAKGTIFGKATKMVGVKDTATTGSKKTLQEGIREIIQSAIDQAQLQLTDIQAVFSSGMITSEIGLAEIPHLEAPCGIDELAGNIKPVTDLNIIDGNIPVYFIRGIKNRMNTAGRSATKVVGELDFMRGEETQVMGLLEHPEFSLPAIVLILSSHTKFIPIDATGLIQGSLTTMSGQIYDAVINHTFVGKSVANDQGASEVKDDFFDSAIVEDAIDWIEKAGLVRSLMYPRFLDVLLHNKWYERHLFFEALIAAEDMLAIGQLDFLIQTMPSNFYLVGTPERCRLYMHILERQFPKAKLGTISDIREIDELSIKGILRIVKKAGLIG